MKRLLVLALLALVALGVTTTLAPAASTSDAKGPPCANVTNGDGGYASTGVLDFTVFVQNPACSFVTYSFVVTDTSGDVITPISATQPDCIPEPGGGCVRFVYDLGTSAPTTVCVYATTSIQAHIVDRAPNASDPTCPASSPSTSLTMDAGGAAGGFN
jgi:hypothetical protein